jgi:hypothetical protein
VKHIRCLIICSILLLTPLINTANAFEDPLFTPVDVELPDLGYNQTNKIAAQWWYFDAVFSNNYSLVVGIFHFSIASKIGFFFIRINLYENGHFRQRSYQFIPLKQITYSTDKPELSYLGSQIYGAEYDNNQRINVHLNVTVVDTQVNLTFSELTKGWKGYTGRGWWSCPTPKANVTGTLRIHNNYIPVMGKGYHEHAWLVQSMHRNWKWGKFSSPSTNTIFSKNMKNFREEDIFLVVINTDDYNYTSINRNNISYQHIDYIFDHGKLIPIKSKLEINQHPIYVNVTFSAKTLHFTSLILLNYWRFHMQITGYITVNNQTEEINDKQIMEYLYLF